MKYLLGAKPKDHQFLFAAVNVSEETQYYEFLDESGFFHQFRFFNDLALNKSNLDVRVGFLEYMQTDSKGKETLFSWVTNIRITQINVCAIMKGGRSRWKIENETFDTLKNLGYNFEHNYGHGKKYLSTIFCLLMLLSFLIDQILGIACDLFRAVKKTSLIFSNSLGKDKSSIRICGAYFLGVFISIYDRKKKDQYFLSKRYVL